MAQLTSLILGGTLRAIGGSWRCERVLANAGNALMMMHAVGWGGCVRGAVAGDGACEGRAEGRRMRADNRIEAAGAASLAPSLGRMTQLTSLDLYCTLRASAGLALFVDDCDRRLCDDDVCCGPRRLRATL